MSQALRTAQIAALNDYAPLPLVADLAVRFAVVVTKWDRMRKTRKQLRKLDPHLLHDIGLDPITAETARPRHGLFQTVAIHQHITYSQNATQFQQARIADHVGPSGRFAHEVNGTIGCDRQGHRANPGQDCQIHPNVSQGEHRRARYSPTGAQMPILYIQAHPNPFIRQRINAEIIAELGKFGRHKRLKRWYIHLAFHLRPPCPRVRQDQHEGLQMTILHRHDAASVATLTMDAPARLNALSDEMLAALHDSFDAIAEDANVRVVVLRGTGKAFCAGHDLKEMQAGRQAPDGGAAYFKDLFDRCAAMMQRIQSLPQPVIAQVHGIATAAGCQLVATCDMAIAADETRFGVNGVNIGLFCSTPMVALTRNIHRKAAFEMLTTGRFINAREAQELGLINRSVHADALERETQELALAIAAKLPVAVKIGKQAFYEQLQMSIDAAYTYAGEVMVQNMLDQQTDEGINAFLEKRDPNWS